ncbi:MAG: hypothetical protein IT457_07380 [Planctomycetes bacterium]|nr:hypothetical protein [Planctomycetota bacterium]
MMDARPLVVAALIAASVPGQRDQGPMIALPLHVTFGPGTPNPAGAGTASTTRSYARKAGFGALAPSSPRAGRPDFSFAAVFGLALPIRVDAFSIGMDELHTTCDGIMEFTTCNCWNVLLFTVEDQTGAASAAGVVAQEHARPDGAGADVFSYVPITARLIATDLRGQTARAADSTELGAFRPGPTPSKGRIDSLDTYVALWELDDAVVAHLPLEPTVYFSVTEATKAAVPTPWWAGSTPSGATILRRKWDATSGAWRTLPPLHTAAELGVPASADIDALAYNEGGDDLLISFTRATTPAGLSQLVYVANCVDGTSLTDLTERDSSGTGTRRVADGTGAGSGGEVSGVCVDDPSVRASQPPLTVGLMAHVRGTPDEALVAAWTSLAAQTHRSCDALGNVTYTAHLTGLPAGGGSSLAVWLVGIPNLGAFSTPLFTVLGRPVAGAGDPTSQAAILLPPLTNLNSAPVQGMWVAVNTTTGDLALSHPVTIHL